MVLVNVAFSCVVAHSNSITNAVYISYMGWYGLVPFLP